MNALIRGLLKNVAFKCRPHAKCQNTHLNNPLPPPLHVYFDCNWEIWNFSWPSSVSVYILSTMHFVACTVPVHFKSNALLILILECQKWFSASFFYSDYNNWRKYLIVAWKILVFSQNNFHQRKFLVHGILILCFMC